MKRHFYVALGIPREADTESVRVAYRKLVTRYRRMLDPEPEPLDDPTEPPLAFQVMRTYSERRHSALFDQPEPLVTKSDSEVDRFFSGYVPEVETRPRARRAGKDLFVELRLDEDEARRGGLFPVHIPVVKPCPSCASGGDEPLVCSFCGDARQVTEDRIVEVTVPPSVQHGQVARIAMDDVGLERTDLIVLVVIS
jgi:DnaJ-class molecular chaperone